MVVHHIDGDSLNNRIENLQAMTREEHKKQLESPLFYIQKRYNPNLDTTYNRGLGAYFDEEFEAFCKKEDAARALNMTNKKFDKWLKGMNTKGTSNPHGCAPDRRMVIRLQKVYPPKDVLSYFRTE